MISQSSVSDLLQGARQLNPAEFESFFKKIEQLRSEKTEEFIAPEQRRLLQKIKSGLPLQWRERFHFLIARRDAEALLPQEYQELLEMTEQFEQFELHRLRLLSKLAEARGESLPEIVERFKLQPPAHA